MTKGEFLPNGISPDYHPISLDEEQALVSQICEQTTEFSDNDSRFGLVTFRPYSSFSNLARSVESEVFDEFFGNDPELMSQEYGPYEDASKFFLVIDREHKRKAGVMRLLHNSDAGFKALRDVRQMGLTSLSESNLLGALGAEQADGTIEIATIAAAPDYRGTRSDGIVSAAMYRALYQYCIGGGYNDLIAVIDAKPLQNLRDIHLPVNTTPEVITPFEYLDAKENSLIHIPILEIEGHMRSKDPDTFDFLLGRPGGLDPFCTLSLTEK